MPCQRGRKSTLHRTTCIRGTIPAKLHCDPPARDFALPANLLCLQFMTNWRYSVSECADVARRIFRHQLPTCRLVTAPVC